MRGGREGVVLRHFSAFSVTVRQKEAGWFSGSSLAAAAASLWRETLTSSSPSLRNTQHHVHATFSGNLPSSGAFLHQTCLTVCDVQGDTASAHLVQSSHFVDWYALGCRFYNALSCRLHTSGTYFFTVTCDPWKQELIIRYRLWRSHALLNVRAEWQFDVSAASCFRLHVEHLPFTLTFGPPLLVGPPFPITGVWNGAPGPLKPTSGWTQSPSNWIPRRKWLAVTAWAVDTAAWMRRAMTSPSSPPRPPSFASRRPSQ